MRTPSHHLTAAPRRQAGLSLVELMVAMAISLILVAAASYVYLGTREAQRSIDDVAATNDSGAYALQLIGREAMNAGFYPALRDEDGGNVFDVSRYSQAISTAPAAYEYGIFGCEGSQFDPTTNACGASDATKPDSIMIAYFSNDGFGGDAGQSLDCNGNPIRDAAFNATRKGTSDYEPPLKPLLVSNRFGLSASTTTIEDKQVQTLSLGCNGNASGAEYSSVLSGIEDLQITYGISPASGASQAPERFLNATQVNALPQVVIDGETVKGWGRVVAVRVCVVAHSVASNTKLRENAAGTRTYLDCNGNEQTQDAADTRMRKSYYQVFGLRNRQSATY